MELLILGLPRSDTLLNSLDFHNFRIIFLFLLFANLQELVVLCVIIIGDLSPLSISEGDSVPDLQFEGQSF
jgi:hypothetical protein